ECRDSRPETVFNSKLKKRDGGSAPELKLAANPDILSTIAQSSKRPRLVIGFAAETDDVVAHAKEKRAKKGADWIVANDVSPSTGIMGGDDNKVHLITADRVEAWPTMKKSEVAARLVARIVAALGRVA
ncbi:MAG TPA: phosphopantothenoylcysteine decarboxylase, partial [Rhizomicrobium sp.]